MVTLLKINDHPLRSFRLLFLRCCQMKLCPLTNARTYCKSPRSSRIAKETQHSNCRCWRPAKNLPKKKVWTTTDAQTLEVWRVLVLHWQIPRLQTRKRNHRKSPFRLDQVGQGCALLEWSAEGMAWISTENSEFFQWSKKTPLHGIRLGAC